MHSLIPHVCFLLATGGPGIRSVDSLSFKKMYQAPWLAKVKWAGNEERLTVRNSAAKVFHSLLSGASKGCQALPRGGGGGGPDLVLY